MEGNQNKNQETLAYLYSRIQRATEAVYRVTDLLSDREPMKWKMREESTFIFTHLSVMKNKHSLERGAYLERIADTVERLAVLFSLFEESGSAVLSANFRVLKKEYESIKDFISEETKQEDISHLFLDETPKSLESPIGQKENEMSDNMSVRNTPKQSQEKKEERVKPKEAIVEKSKQKIEQKKNDSPAVVPVKNNKSKPVEIIRVNSTDRPVFKKTFGGGKDNSKSEGKEGISKGQERKKKIFEIVKDRQEVTVGELSSIFNEYSEKTIQRDLLEFVSKGVLKKEGDKRWRKYMLV